MNCPKCNTTIQKEDINISTDLAMCQKCSEVFKLSEYIGSALGGGEQDFDINTPAAVTWYSQNFNQIVIGASTRSPIAFFLVPFMIVWSGGSIGGIYGTQFFKGEFDLIPSLFGIPFILGSLLFWSIALMTIWGKVELTIDREGGKIFTGLGSIGKTQTFLWSDIAVIKETISTLRYNNSNATQITMEGKKRITFGSMLNDSRKYYLLKALQKIRFELKPN